MTTSGVILAGGSSSRMGTDKALLDFSGVPLWRHQLSTLAGAGFSPLAVVRRPGQPRLGGDVLHLEDSMRDIGPIAGLDCALAASGTPLLAVLAVDMPSIDAAWFRELRAACPPGAGAVASHPDGFEPLAALYPTSARPIIRAQLNRGRHSLRALAAELVAAGLMADVPIDAGDRWKVANWNRPEEVWSAESRGALRGGPRRKQLN